MYVSLSIPFPITQADGEFLAQDWTGAVSHRKPDSHRVVKVEIWDGYEGVLTDVCWDDGDRWSFEMDLAHFSAVFAVAGIPVERGVRPLRPALQEA